MPKILEIPEGVKFYEMNDDEIEILILPSGLERIDIKSAQNLKKIISHSNAVTFGPKCKTIGIPVLNKCPKLNEIITYGDIDFNTAILINCRVVSCAWLKEGQDAPTLTSVGFDYLLDFPCYSWIVGDGLFRFDDAYPNIRMCSFEKADVFIAQVMENPDEVTKTKLHQKEIGTQF